MSDDAGEKKPPARPLSATPPKPRPSDQPVQFDSGDRMRPDDRLPDDERDGDVEQFRVFVAVAMPSDALVALQELQSQLRAEPTMAWNVKWPRNEGLHVTMAFLGGISPTRAKVVSRAVAEVASAHRPFAIDLHGLGAFPKSGRARVLWVGVRSGAEVLCRIQRELETRLIRNGFPREERAFEPHLTLARLQAPSDMRGLLQKFQRFSVPSVAIGSIQVMLSELRRDGAIYTVLSTAALGAPLPSEQSA